MHKHIALGIAVVATLAVVILMFGSLIPWEGMKPLSAPRQSAPADSTESAMKSYDAPEFGVSFDYPAHYLLSEEELGTAARGHYRIELIEDTPENRALKAGLAPGREGPPSITFDVFQNNLDKTKLVAWVKGNGNSNFKLSDGTYVDTEIADTPAVFYQHSGLYEANAFVFTHGGNIIKATATYLTPDDLLLDDFSSILSTLDLY